MFQETMLLVLCSARASEHILKVNLPGIETVIIWLITPPIAWQCK